MQYVQEPFCQATCDKLRQGLGPDLSPLLCCPLTFCCIRQHSSCTCWKTVLLHNHTVRPEDLSIVHPYLVLELVSVRSVYDVGHQGKELVLKLLQLCQLRGVKSGFESECLFDALSAGIQDEKPFPSEPSYKTCHLGDKVLLVLESAGGRGGDILEAVVYVLLLHVPGAPGVENSTVE